MNTIKIFYNNQPILSIIECDITGNLYGLNRDRNPDNGWGELRKTIISQAKEVELTDELKQILIEDLAYVYGQDSKKFSEKLKEFKLKII